MSALLSEARERLVQWQAPGESELFRLLNLLRLLQPEQDLRRLGRDEARYFEFYRNCFLLEVASLLLLVPVGLCGLGFYRAFRKPRVDPGLVRARLARLLLCGVPTLNLFVLNTYRRYVQEVDCEKPLERKYARELRDLRKRGKGQ